jgi:glutathione S-transferase
MYKLYSAPGTCATAIHIVLEWIGKPYEVEHLDFAGMKSADYMAINPSGVVPTLVEDGQPLMEAVSQLIHLVDANPDANIGPQVGEKERPELYRWLSYFGGTLHPYYWPHFMPMRWTSDEQGQPAVVEASHVLIGKSLALIDAHLAGKEWVLGDKKSVADAYLYPMASWAYGLPKAATDYKHLHAWMTKMVADPAVMKVHAAQGTNAKVKLAA